MGIMLTEGFKNLEEGPAQVLRISKVSYDRKYDKCRVTFADESNGTCTEQFMFVKNNGEQNEVAMRIFSTLAFCATRDFTVREIEPEDIQGCRVVADVTVDHVVNEETGRANDYYHVKNFKEAPEEFADDEDPFA